jgi:hypothetical protein
MMAIGGSVRGGIYGTAPNLDPNSPTLENNGNDVRHETDFRRSTRGDRQLAVETRPRSSAGITGTAELYLTSTSLASSFQLPTSTSNFYFGEPIHNFRLQTSDFRLSAISTQRFP